MSLCGSCLTERGIEYLDTDPHPDDVETRCEICGAPTLVPPAAAREARKRAEKEQ